MPLFMNDDELSRSEAPLVAEKADEFIKKLYAELESVKAKSDAAAITAEQTCSLLEQKYISLSQEFSAVESQNAKLQSAIDKHLAELAQTQSQKHQLHLQLIGKDGDIERLTTEVSEIHKSKRQLLELAEQKDMEISEKNATIKNYLDKIVNLTDSCAEKDSRFAELDAGLSRLRASCSRLTQEKELIEKHNAWLNEEFTAKVDSFNELRRRHADLEAETSEKLSNNMRKFEECSSSLDWHKERLREFEVKTESLQEDLRASKNSSAAMEEQYSAELNTANRLVDLYKESSEEWSRKAGELEGVIKALEARLKQVENDYEEKLEKETSTRKQLEKEAVDYKEKLEKCEAEIEKNRKDNELKLPFSSFTSNIWSESLDARKAEESQDLVPKIPAGVSGTALAASLLRDGWSLAKMYEKYQEAVDALRHEQLGRKEAESVLQRVLYELEEKAGVILDERAEYEKMVDAYTLINDKLKDSVAEQSNLEKVILELKADLRRRERENNLAQKEISDLQKQVTILLKECRDVQLRCGVAQDDESDDSALITDEINADSDADRTISEHLSFRDINGLVEQNVKLRSLTHSLSDQIENREKEVKEKFELELKKVNDEAASKVAAVLERAEEQGRMIESLHTSVAMYKRLYEESHKLQSPDSNVSNAPQGNARKDLLLLLEGSKEATKKTQEKYSERVKCLEEDLAKARSEVLALRFDRDKLSMEANFSKEKLESVMKESERQREEANSILARNIEFSQLIVDYQRKVRESGESLNAAEEVSRKLSMELSLLKNEKDLLSNAEKRACDEVRMLSERVYRLQASLDTLQSAEEVREEARAAERRKQEEHVRQIEREWAEAKKELEEERNNVRNLTSDREQTLKNAMKQVEDIGKELANALKSVAAAESRAAVAEAKLSDLSKATTQSEAQALEIDGNGTLSSSSEIVSELRAAKEEMEKLKEEVEANKNHMLQYKGIAQVNEAALKDMELAHENFKQEAEKRQKTQESELLSLRTRISELESECIRKSEEVTAAAAGKEEALASALAEVTTLKEENFAKSSHVASLESQISALKNDLENEHERYRVAHGNYERQVVLQSETIQELKKTSQALATLQEEASELRKSADALKAENSELKARWEAEKSLLEDQKNLAEKKYDETNEQNKILHNRLEALHIQIAEKERHSTDGSSGIEIPSDSGLQNVVNYLRRSKEIAETEISLLKQEKLRLQAQVENAVKASENAQALLNAERAQSRASLMSEDQIRSLQLQVGEMNLLRESNMQLREENKHNFEECQKLREAAHNAKKESETLENQLRERQIELDSYKKDVEKHIMEKDENIKRMDELLAKFKNIDVADYERLKNDVIQLEEKLKEKDAQLEDVKKGLSEKQDKISKLEKDLTNSKVELSERENKLNEAQQGHEERHKRMLAHFKRKIDTLNKEKDEINKENQTLSKQLEELKQSKRSTQDTGGEQAVKERGEREHRIQMLEKVVEKLRSDLKKKDEESKKKDEESKKKEENYNKEKVCRLSAQKTFKETLSKVAQEKTYVQSELEKFKPAVERLSNELDKLKHAEANLPEGTSIVKVLTGNMMDDRACAYLSAIESFEKVAQSLSNALGSGSRPSDAPGDSSQDTTLVAPSSQQTKAAVEEKERRIEEKERRITLSKASAETRRSGTGRKLLRPHLGKHGEPQADQEMSEAEGSTHVGKQSQETDTQGNIRKRQAASSASEVHEESREEAGTDIAPPLPKKSKASDVQLEAAKIEPTAAVENLSTIPTVDDSLETQGLTEETTEAEKEEGETSEEKAEEAKLEETREPQQLDRADEADLQGDDEANEPTEDQTYQDLQQADTESEKEEGELPAESAEQDGATDTPDVRSPEIGEQGELGVTPTASPLREDFATEEGEAMLEEGLSDEKNEDVDAMEEGGEGSDKPNDSCDPPAEDADPRETVEAADDDTKNANIIAELDSKNQSESVITKQAESMAITGSDENTQESPTSVAETSVSKMASARTATDSEASKQPYVETETSKRTSSSATADPEPAKQATPSGSSEAEGSKQTSPLHTSTIVNLSERAKERSALRQAGQAGAQAPAAATTRGRGRILRSRVPRGGRAARGGRGQPPGQH